jgi:hypothetical protein
MSLSRRQIIGAGAVAGALAFMSSPLLAALPDPSDRSRSGRLAGLRIDEIDPPANAIARPAPVSTAAHLSADPNIDPLIMARARAAFDRHRASLAFVDVIGIADFTRASSEPRFYLLDTNSGRVSRHLVAHGRGSDPAHTGFLQRFSNAMGSEASSNGAYVTGEFYPGRYGRAMRVRGLDESNSNAEARAIVVHSAWYAEPAVLASNGRLGRSEGCFALPYSGLQEVLARLGPGRFLYADRLA